MNKGPELDVSGELSLLGLCLPGPRKREWPTIPAFEKCPNGRLQRLEVHDEVAGVADMNFHSHFGLP